MLRTVDLPTLDAGSAREHLAEMVARRNAINDSAPVSSFIAYALGKRNIKKGRPRYEVDG